jgi:hypothetical protein
MSTTTQRLAQPSTFDEISIHGAAASMCLLVNRRHQTARIIDFRSGASLAKRNAVLTTAKREGIEKLFVLVERDEGQAWAKLGFRREGDIPGFYKRSDATVMGAVVASIAPMRGDLDDEDDLEEAPAADLARANAAVQEARALAKTLTTSPTVKLAALKRDAAQTTVAAATKAGRALSGFEPFSRDADRTFFAATARGGFEAVISCEAQPTFASSMIELAAGPREAGDCPAFVAALRGVSTKLAEAATSSAFALVPSTDVPLLACYLASGFKRSALLASHLVVKPTARSKPTRVDAIVVSLELGKN